MLEQLHGRVKVGVVGGSDLVKQKEQLGEDSAWWSNGAPRSHANSFAAVAPQS